MVEERPVEGPEWVGPYRILGRLGDGGMGVVYLAERLEPVRQRVALKLMRDDRQGAEFVARFEMERKALERMQHPNIASVLGGGVTAAGRPFFAMEYVPGLAIDRYCDEKALTIEARLELFTQVCSGVQHAHTNGIMHRDLKPSNILVFEVDDRPVAKIIDFGLARAIDLHGQRATLFEELKRVIGTLAYMSPEQAGLETSGVDARTDVYSLGVLLYELLTGRLPHDAVEFERIGVLAAQQVVREREPSRPSTHFSTVSAESIARAERRHGSPRALWRQVVGELDWIVLKAMQKDRTARYVTVRDLARDLDNYLRHRPVEAGPPSQLYRLRKWVRRHRAGVAAGTIAAASVLSALVIALWVSTDLAAARAETLRATREAMLISDPLVLDSLERSAERLWPAMPEQLLAIEQWLGLGKQLVQRRQEQQQFLELLATDATRARLHARIREHCEQLDRFVASDGLLASVERRRGDAVTIVERTVGGANAEPWQAAARRMRDNPRYAGMEQLVPQVGLVPIGVDPASGLEEFAVLQSGVVPVRGADQRFPLRVEDAIVLVLLPGGTATIGFQGAWIDGLEPNGAERRELPVTTVRLAPYFLGKYEMTQGQWLRVTGKSDSSFRPDPSYDLKVAQGKWPAAPTWLHPVETHTWHECTAVLRQLDLELPTEAQWEFAARCGAASPWYFFAGGVDWSLFGKHANVADAFAAIHSKWPEKADAVRLGVHDGFLFSAAVGSLLPNPWGFHDIHGNVWEWCRDPYTDDNYEKGLRDGDGACNEGDEWSSVVRGGGYISRVGNTRASYREISPRDSRWRTHGVRAARRYDSARR